MIAFSLVFDRKKTLKVSITDFGLFGATAVASLKAVWMQKPQLFPNLEMVLCSLMFGGFVRCRFAGWKCLEMVFI